MRQARPRTRRVWRAVHAWLGLTLGALFAAISLTGIAISYWHEIDRALNGFPAPTSRPVPLVQVIQAATVACPGCGPPIELFRPPPAGVVSVYFRPAPPGGLDEVVVDEASARPLLRRRDDPVAVLYRLHSSLFLGDVGRWLVAAMALGLVASLLSGLWLWWPRAGGWRFALRVPSPARSWAAFWYGLHRTLGSLASLVLLVAALSGALIAEPTLTARLLAPLGADDRHVPAAAGRASRREDPDRYVDAALARFPGATWNDIELPTARNAPVAVHLKRAREAGHYGDTVVWMARAGGEVLAVRDGGARPLGTAVAAYLVPLHSGYALGEVARLIFAIAAAVPLVLFVSGLAFWLSAPRRAERLSLGGPAQGRIEKGRPGA